MNIQEGKSFVYKQTKKFRPQRNGIREISKDTHDTHLLKVTSSLEDDPLYEKAYLHDAVDFSCIPIVQEIHTSHDLLTPLIETVWSALNKGYARRMPESAFAYYAAVLTAARNFQVIQLNGFEVSYDERRFVEQVRSGNYFIPKVLSTYLAGVGNTKIPNGCELKYNMLRPQRYVRAAGKNGWFGRVGPNTHYLYKAYPCLAVYASRIQCDIAFSQGEALPVQIDPEEFGLPSEEEPAIIEVIEGEEEAEQAEDVEEEEEAAFVVNAPSQPRHVPVNPNWNLPEAIQPRGQLGLPTQNLLGYKRATKLGYEMQWFLASLGITADHFPSQNRSFPFHLGLMSAVSSELTYVSKLKKGVFPTLARGSLGQLPFLEFGGQPHCALPMSTFNNLGAVGYLGASFGYRVKHTVGPINPWAIYECDHFRAVPLQWQQTVNNLRATEPKEINIRRFNAPPFLPHIHYGKLCE